MGGSGRAKDRDASTRPIGPAAAEAETLSFGDEEASDVRVQAEATLPAVAPRAKSPRFEEQGELGRGGTGTIHRRFDHVILRTVAVKRLHEAARLIPGAAARFLEEAQITGQLDHPNIVPVHDVELDAEGLPVAFTMKLVRGKTLRVLADELHGNAFDANLLEALVGILVKVCDAVAFAHSRGVIHRDLKPDNVMVGSHGQVYVMDWGVALLRSCSRPSLRVGGAGAPEAPAPRGPVVVGTPAYMAPEQAEGDLDALDERTDVFGIGAILYRVLTGRAPFAAKGSSAAIERARSGGIDPPEQVVPELRLPPGLVRVTMRALAKDPIDRYSSAVELGRALEDFLRGGGWFRTLEFRAGTVLVRAGDAPDAAFIIQSGRCEAYKIIAGKKQSLLVMGPGEAFGETSIFAQQPRAASVVALDDVVLTEITLDALERECARSSWMRTFVSALAERFLELDRQLTDLRAERSDDPESSIVTDPDQTKPSP